VTTGEISDGNNSVISGVVVLYEGRGLVREVSSFWRKADIPAEGLTWRSEDIDSENPKVFEVMSRCRVCDDVLF
jgi:hypothetical protein